MTELGLLPTTGGTARLRRAVIEDVPSIARRGALRAQIEAVRVARGLQTRVVGQDLAGVRPTIARKGPHERGPAASRPVLQASPDAAA